MELIGELACRGAEYSGNDGSPILIARKIRYTNFNNNNNTNSRVCPLKAHKSCRVIITTFQLIFANFKNLEFAIFSLGFENFPSLRYNERDNAWIFGAWTRRVGIGVPREYKRAAKLCTKELFPSRLNAAPFFGFLGPRGAAGIFRFPFVSPYFRALVECRAIAKKVEKYLRPHCSRRKFFPAASRCPRDKSQFGRCRVLRRWPPRTVTTKTWRSGQYRQRKFTAIY